MSIVRFGTGVRPVSSMLPLRRKPEKRDREVDDASTSTVAFKRFRFMEARSRMSPDIDEDIPFLDVGETSKIGAMLFEVRRCPFELEEKMIMVGVNDSTPTKVRILDEDCRNYSEFRIVLASRFRRNSEIVFWRDDLPLVDQRSFLVARRSLNNIVTKMTDEGPAGEIRRRYLRETEFPDSVSVSLFIATVNKSLNEKIHESHSILLTYPGISGYVCETYGQLILAIMVSSGSLSFVGRRCGPPLRLMFLWLENWVACISEGMRHRLLNMLFDRVMKETCDSCFELSLMFEEDCKIMTYPYGFDSLLTTETRYMGVKPGRALRYESREHGKIDIDCLSWRTWEHNYLSPSYAKGTMVFLIKCNDDSYREIPVYQHLGMSLIQCLHFMQKGLKRAVYGGGNAGLIQAVRDGGFHNNEMHSLKELIVDLIILSRSVVELKCLCENIATLITLCVVPQNLVSIIPRGAQGIDYYDTLVRFTFNSSSNVTSEFIQTFKDRLGVEAVRARLNDEDIILTMVHYQG